MKPLQSRKENTNRTEALNFARRIGVLTTCDMVYLVPANIPMHPCHLEIHECYRLPTFPRSA